VRREILLVEDEWTLALSLGAKLEKSGYQVRVAPSGNAALAALDERTPDLILLDIMMPGLDGRETCRRMRERKVKTPIVFLTSLDTPEDELTALASGGDMFIVKTVPDDILLARLAALLRLREDAADEAGDFDFGPWHVESEKLAMTSPAQGLQPLTEREVAFLRLLAANEGVVFSRDAILSKLWGVETDITDNALSTFVYVLRKKLRHAASCLVSVRQSGYAYRKPTR